MTIFLHPFRISEALLYFMEQSVSSEANSPSGGHEISHIS
jgi:hypothetical protein